MTPATPQRSMSGVSSFDPRTRNTLLMVPETSAPELLNMSASAMPGSVHSRRASTCSRRLQCLIPASAGFSPSRTVAQAHPHALLFSRGILCRPRVAQRDAHPALVAAEPHSRARAQHPVSEAA